MKSKEWLAGFAGFVFGCVVFVVSVLGFLYFDTIWWLVGFYFLILLLYPRITRWLSISSVSTVKEAQVDCETIKRLRAKLQPWGSDAIWHIVVRGICDELEKGLILNGDRILLASRSARMVKLLLDEGSLSEKDCREAVHKGLLQYGREMYVQYQRLPMGQLLSPQALGYAAAHGTVTAEELATVHSSDNDLIEQYKENPGALLDSVMKRLRAGPPASVFADVDAPCDGNCFHP